MLNGHELAKTSTQIKEPGQLFGNLWREGEVAILFGETATGKSILATQIAESIARGDEMQKEKGKRKNGEIESLNGLQFRTPHSALRSQEVLNLDFERTLAQFQERYSARRLTSTRRIKYRFSKNFNRVDLGYFEDAANDIKGDLSRFLLDAAYREIRNHTARVVIIDNILYLSRATGNSAGVRLMKTLKLWSGLHGISILAVAHKPDRGRPRPLSLAGLPQFASLADTVFAPSSMSPEIRYIKHLKSSRNTLSSPPGLRRGGDASSAGWSGNDTLTFQLARQSEPGAIAAGLLNSPPCLGGVAGFSSPPGLRRGADASSAGWSADGVVVARSTINSQIDRNSQLSTINSQLNEGPFLALTYLGHAAEQEHIRDYEREARDAHDREQKRLREWHQSSRTALIEGYFDGSYARYLKGK